MECCPLCDLEYVPTGFVDAFLRVSLDPSWCDVVRAYKFYLQYRASTVSTKSARLNILVFNGSDFLCLCLQLTESGVLLVFMYSLELYSTLSFYSVQ
jgi:hypothetical protein